MRKKIGGKIVIACSGGKHLAKDIANRTKAEYSEVLVERFPDTEIKIKIKKDLKGKNVYFIQSFYDSKEGDINDKLIEVLFSAYTAKDMGAKKVILVAPYLAYLREDKRFSKGEVVSAEIIPKIFKIFNKVYVVDPHLHRFKTFKEFFSKAKKISLVEEISDYIKKIVKKDYVLVGPDLESEQWVKTVAKQLDSDYFIMNKTRFSSRKVKVKGKNVENQTVIIIDDIISTGETLIQACKLIKAKQIYFIAMHGVFAKGALNKLKKKGKVVVSNTIPSKVSKIDCTKTIAKRIK